MWVLFEVTRLGDALNNNNLPLVQTTARPPHTRIALEVCSQPPAFYLLQTGKDFYEPQYVIGGRQVNDRYVEVTETRP
jgi:hypothetical protein